MIVVADTSPILNLERIGHLDLLPKLYDRVMIPRSVEVELARFRVGAAWDSAYASWLSVVDAADRRLVHQLSRQLDSGEAEAIALAVERRATLLLIDEKQGRRVAEELGLGVTGLLGVLVEAKHRGLLETLKPVLDDLMSSARFWISSELYREVLARTGEL